MRRVVNEDVAGPGAENAEAGDGEECGRVDDRGEGEKAGYGRLTRVASYTRAMNPTLISLPRFNCGEASRRANPRSIAVSHDRCSSR